VWRALSGASKVVVGGAAAVALVVVLALVAPFDLPSPFDTEQVERDHAVVLASLEDLSRYVAATGRFQAVVDIEQDAKYLPDFVKGERIILIAEGDVEAYVDLSTLDDGDLVVDEDRIVITVPAPQLSEPRLDPSKTEVVANDRGLVDRIDDALTSGDPSPDSELYQQADAKITEAAGQSDLVERARGNTETFLTTLFEAAGFTEVVVVFDDPTART
jgi:hypothetical protein